jgi:NADP-dependent alcohol dehydrogenase
MVDFTFERRTRLIFGEKKIEKLKSHLPPNAKVLFLYGGGSIKANGIYDRVKQALDGFKHAEFGGIEPNPHYDTCLKAVELIKNEGLNFVLAVGGGSVMDAAKFIALAANYKGDNPWELVSNNAPHVVPIELGVIVTLPATGSEMNNGFVISNTQLKLKHAGHSPYTVPMFAIEEPSATLSLNLRQTSNGIADAYIHVMEQYCTVVQDTFLQDRWAEGIMQTLIDCARPLMANLQDITARRTLMHAATMALNGYISMGVGVTDWATHMIGHELTILYGVDHGRTLTAVLPSLLRVQKEIKKEKLVLYGKNVFGITSGSDDEIAEKAIKATEEFFTSIHMPIRISQLEGVAADAPDVIGERFLKANYTFGQKGSIDGHVAKEILLLAQKS